jgi:hypothetical protein
MLELVFSQQIMHQQAPLAAKDLVRHGKAGVAARLAAVKAGGALGLAGPAFGLPDAGGGNPRRSHSGLCLFRHRYAESAHRLRLTHIIPIGQITHKTFDRRRVTGQ